MSLMTRIEVGMIGLLLSLGSSAAISDVIPVVSSRSTVSALSNSQLVDIFLGKTNQFPNGEQAIPIDQAEGSEVRDEFYQKFTSKSAAQIRAYWAKIIFTGKGQPPKEASSGERVKKLIAENPHFIGYIERSALDASMKMVTVVDFPNAK